VQEIATKCKEQIHMFSCELLMQRARSDDEDDGIGGSCVYGHYYKTWVQFIRLKKFTIFQLILIY
jgi:hypothetical protein